MATLKEYLVLSQIAYNDFYIREEGRTIGNLLDNSKLVKSSLINYLNEEGNEVWKN